MWGFNIVIPLMPFLLLGVVSEHVTPYKEAWFEQDLDHFNFYPAKYGQSTFQQHYLWQDKWWDNGSGPIFFYTGNEGAIDNFWNNTGFVFENAPKFKALVIFAEHVAALKMQRFKSDASCLQALGVDGATRALGGRGEH